MEPTILGSFFIGTGILLGLGLVSAVILFLIQKVADFFLEDFEDVLAIFVLVAFVLAAATGITHAVRISRAEQAPKAPAEKPLTK